MKSLRLVALLACLWATMSCPIDAQTYLRLESITGSSTDTNHAGWMDILSATIVDATLTVSKDGNNSRILTGTNFGDLCFSKFVDGASPTLALRCAGGTVITNGTVDFADVSSSQARYFRLNLTNIYITSVQQIAGESDTIETLCLSPQIYSWNYTHYRTNTGLPDAYVFSRWDIQTNSGTLGTNSPAFVTSGIRKTNGIELRWTATAGRSYRIFAVPSLTQPFQSIKELTASFTGNTNYTFTPVLPAMFFVVEELPANY